MYDRQGPSDELSISPLLRADSPEQGLRLWLADMADVHMLLSGVLRIIHPELYEASRLAIVRLNDSPERADVLSRWGSVFNAISVISNRMTPGHRDLQSRVEWFDILTSVGPYSGAKLSLPDLNLELHYPSGSVVAFSGKLLQHAVSDCVGERACVAYYMRDKVHERLGVRAATWMRGWVTFM